MSREIGAVMTASAEPAALPTGWRGPICPVNSPAGDGRVLVLPEGQELGVRPLPLPLSAQRELSDGHDGSTTIGLMERVWLGDGGSPPRSSTANTLPDSRSPSPTT